METGGLGRFQGKTLDDVEVPEDFSDNELDDETVENPVTNIAHAQTEKVPCEGSIGQHKIHSDQTGVSSLHQIGSDHASDQTGVSSHKNDTKRVATRDYLSKTQIALIHEHFRSQIDARSLPGKTQCEDFISKYDEFKCKHWKKISSTVRNEIDKRKRRLLNLRK
jgi:hypothetical protein